MPRQVDLQLNLQPHKFHATLKTLKQGLQGILFVHLFAGGSGPLMSPLPTKLLMSWEDIGTDHPDVPALLSSPVLR